MKKSSHGGAGMIGGVRSPMAAAGHGLVGHKTTAKITGMSRKSMKGGTKISSPQKSGDNV